MYDNNQNSIQMAGQQTKSNGQNGTNSQSNINNSHTLNHNLKNDNLGNGLTNGVTNLQKQIQHPQQLLHQQQQIQQVAQYTQNDLEELGGPEISLDLANFMLVSTRSSKLNPFTTLTFFRDDQFRNEQEQFAFFNKVVPAVVNGVNGGNSNVNGIVQSEAAAKVLNQARFQQHRQNSANALAYMPGAVTGWLHSFYFFCDILERCKSIGHHHKGISLNVSQNNFIIFVVSQENFTKIYLIVNL